MTKRSTRKKETKKVAESSQTWDEVLIIALSPYLTEIMGLLLFLVGTITSVAILGLINTQYLAIWVSFWRWLAGWIALPMTIAIATIGLRVASRRVDLPGWPTFTLNQRIGTTLLFMAIMPLMHLATGIGSGAALSGQGGGWLGLSLAEPIEFLLGTPAAWLLYAGLALYALALILQIKSKDAQLFLRKQAGALREWATSFAPEEEAVIPAPATATGRQRGTIDRKKLEELRNAEQLPLPKAKAKKKESKRKPRKKRRNPNLPPLDILEKGQAIALPKDEIDRKRDLIQTTLEDFGIEADVLPDPQIGPAITQYAVVPRLVEITLPDGSVRKTKVRVSKIASLKQDLALALAAPRIRIQAPVPGKGIVGIEVPNDKNSIVRLGDVLDTPEYHGIRGTMGNAVGLDVSGRPVASDTTKLPHMLVAGQTGSGKSVFINALITCLIMNNTPEDLQLVMIDPKKVELIRFNGLPHLLGKVEVEGERAIGVLRWLTAEMDERYQKLAAIGARNISSYNQKVKKFPDTKPMPYIVAFIDELADLMVQYGGELERALCRLAQMARATGIHLIVATQRPSTDVLTGLIKANFPARASFAVASGTDSRVILDSIGAESLLGKGDMLFLAADASTPLRVQGCFVSDEEIDRIVSFWKEKYPGTRPSAPWNNLIEKQEFLQEKDDMLERAISLAQKYDSISSSMLQRRLRIGYPRASRLMQDLYEMGLVEDPQSGGRTRRSLVDTETDDPLKKFIKETGDTYKEYPDKPDFDNLVQP